MTSFQDLPPQSRRALRQERSQNEEIDDSADAVRVPSGRRARAAEPEPLVQVANDGQHDDGGADRDLPNATQAAHDDEPVDVFSVGARAGDEQHGNGQAGDAAVVPDSAVPKAFPFAGQVEATSDDAGHTGFRLRDFSPELSTSRAEAQSASDWAPASGDESVQLDYQTQGGPVFGYVSPYSEPAVGSADVDSASVDQSASETAATDAASETPFDSLFSDLLAPEATVEEDHEKDSGPVDNSDSGDMVATPSAAVPIDAVPVGEPIIVSEPVAPVEPVVVAEEERTLSRREWRAMRAQAQAEAEAAAAAAAPAEAAPEPESTLDVLFQQPDVQQPEVQQPDVQQPEVQQPEATHDDIPTLVEPEAAPQTALSDAMAEFEALTRGGQSSAEPVASPFPSLFAEPSVAAPASDATAPSTEQAAPAKAQAPVEPATTTPTQPESARLAPAPGDTTPSETTPSDTAPRDTATSDATPAAAAPAEAASVDATPAAAPREPFSFLLAPSASPAADQTDAGAYTPPVGHWSRQAQMDDESQPFENTLSRDVGGGNVATTTNALVLPMIPQRDDFSSVLNATGEIMVTGTINLPGSVGSTGRDSRHYDDPEVDHLFDAFDTEIASTDSAPVRAITAVSSHTATRGGIEAGRKQSNRMLNVLLVTACVMAAAVAGLLIAGFVFKIF